MKISVNNSDQNTNLIRITIADPKKFNYLFSIDRPFTDIGLPNEAKIEFSSVLEMGNFIDMLNRAYKEYMQHQGKWRLQCPHCGRDIGGEA